MSRTRAVQKWDLVYNYDTAELGFLIAENPIGEVLELRDGIAVVHWATLELPGRVQIKGRILRWEVDRLGRRHPVCEEQLSSLRPLVVREATEDDQ